MDNLKDYGWTKADQLAWDELALADKYPARVIADFGTSLKIATPIITAAELSGKLAHYSSADATPKVGDWVAVTPLDNGPAVIESVVLRRNEIARKVAGKQITKQILAANVDIAFVLLALDNDFSVERLQRFLYQLSIHAIDPVIVLNKADKTNHVQSYRDQIDGLGLPVIVTIASEGKGIDDIMQCIQPGQTAILLGSSGVGKSTMTNKLLQREVQQTNTLRVSDATGKHTTVHRELFVLPNGGLLIDTPGIRELRLWGTEEDLNLKFQDITSLSSKCKYPDCHHDNEAGCAIKKALQNGMLDKRHYANYLKMKTELATLAKKGKVHARKSNKRPRKQTDWQDTDE